MANCMYLTGIQIIKLIEASDSEYFSERYNSETSHYDKL